MKNKLFCWNIIMLLEGSIKNKNYLIFSRCNSKKTKATPHYFWFLCLGFNALILIKLLGLCIVNLLIKLIFTETFQGF